MTQNSVGIIIKQSVFLFLVKMLSKHRKYISNVCLFAVFMSRLF